jgi:hypothetical protein
MAKPEMNLTSWLQKARTWPRNYWRRGLWQKIALAFWAVIIMFTAVTYGIAQWYIASERDKPMVFGTSFIPYYAENLGVNPEETLDALLGIGVRQFRFVSYWNDMEREPGNYDFSRLDWQFKKAEAAEAKVSLSIGLRQPRWPECHTPEWAKNKPQSEWQPQLEKFMTAVILRYKDSPSLESYQLENEYFLKGFGECTNFDRGRLISEFNLVKRLDPKHPIIISRSNNAQGIPVNEPKPDIYAISIYKRVWDAGVTKRYMEYPFPGWYYGFLAGAQKMNDGRNMIIHELQAEAWAPNYQSISQISLEEQNKSLDADRLEDRFGYARATGMREAYLWGSEYWYYRYKVLHDPSLWNVAKKEFGGQSSH